MEDHQTSFPDSRNGRNQELDEVLARSIIALPLLEVTRRDPAHPEDVIIDLNLHYRLGRDAAKNRIREIIVLAIAEAGDSGVAQGLNLQKSALSSQYLYARLQGKVIHRLAEIDRAPLGGAIYHIWPDFLVKALISKSVSTIKADACQRAFAATGKNITWAVLDSGIDGSHPHFTKHQNLAAFPAYVQHMDFTQNPPAVVAQPADDCGHGTHVAGIIAGELEEGARPVAITRERAPSGAIEHAVFADMCKFAGVAPQCKLVSFKVLDANGQGPISNVIVALEMIHQINGFGRELVIHGVNLSVGYDFEADWFACGQSPVCVEVDRLVKSGVCVVSAAGNTGRGSALTINDPGNAELAITVGSTHRDMPHTYGVSFFSSKGPTGDGRRKPDLLAPGEKIASCGAGPELACYQAKAAATGPGPFYIERSGTSVAAAHVSGIIAGLLSIRGEFKGRPEAVKKLLMETATDLGRNADFQGRGLVDMMRALQAI